MTRTSSQWIVRRCAPLVVAGAICGAAPAVASAYWDYTGYLSPGSAYGEAQGIVGTWYIRQNRSNCNAKMEIRRRDNGVWSNIAYAGGCADSDNLGGSPYGTNIWDASHGINLGGSDVWVNIRIDGTI